MTDAGWARIEEILDGALERSAGEREAYLAAQCGHDADLRRELAGLLEACAASEGRLEETAAEFAGSLLAAWAYDSDSPLAAGAIPAGESVGPYRIVRVLGRGGMGVVYLAHDPVLDRPVTLKLLPPHLAADPAAGQRLIDEARAASALDSPYIETIYETGRTDEGRVYLAMAYYPGGALSQRLAGGPLPVEEAIRLAAEVARGLAAAHAAGIIHRDIKPSNIVVAASGTARIVDFGIAKTAGRDVTGSGEPRGTVAYMSPEQTRGEELDSRTDIWSLGVVLYEMLAGRRPFEGATDRVVIHAIRRDDPIPLTEARPEVPRRVSKLVLRCLDKEAARRPPSAGVVVDTLAGAVRDRRPRRAPLAAALIATAGGSIGTFVMLGDRGAGAEFVSEPSTGPATRLAVLPLTNVRGDAQIDYLGYALSDQVISRIGYLEGLVVRPSSSVRRFAGGAHSPAAVAETLGVEYVLAGSYLRDGDSLRVNIELIHAGSNRPVWQEPIHTGFDDVFAAQDLVADRVSRRLERELGLEDHTAAGVAAAVDPDAYRLYLQSAAYGYADEAGLAALELLRRSVVRDSTFAPALASLGHRIYWQANSATALGGEREAMYVEAERLLKRALEVNPELLSALGYLATLYTETGRLEESVRLSRRALAINPSDFDARFALSHAYRYAGLLPESVAEFENALALDPGNPRLGTGGIVYLYTGEWERAIEVFGPRSEQHGLMPIFMGVALAGAGRETEARATLHAVTSHPSPVLRAFAAAHLAVLDGDSAGGLHHAGRMDSALAPVEGEVLYDLARLYARFGDTDAAVDRAGKAVTAGFFAYPYMASDALTSGVRDDPRFRDVLERARERHGRFAAEVRR